MMMAVLPTVVSACPAGWTSSPANSCLRVPPERSASLFRCVDLCKERGGTPACIGSAAENAFVTEAFASTGDSLWLGLYQNETALGPARGWDRCVAGDAPSFTSWEKGQPDDQAGFREDCARVDLNTGHWLDLACDGPQVSDDGAEELELPCLCALGNDSAAFADDVEALEATRHYNRRLLSARTARAFIIAVAIAILPTLLLLARAGWHGLRYAEPSVEVQGAAPTQEAALPHALPSQSTTGLALDRRPSATSAAGVKKRLSAARKSAAGRRLRVSFAMVQTGWALFVIAVTPFLMLQTGQPIDVHPKSFFSLFPLGICLLLLALFPTDATAIRIVCITVVVLGTGFALLSSARALRKHNPSPILTVGAVLTFALAGALVPTLWFRGSRAMQPRPALRRLWTAMRLFFLGFGLLWAGVAIATMYAVKADVEDIDRSTFPVRMSTTLLVCAALATPRNRGRLHRRLGRLGGRGTEAEEAAAVAALVGGSNPDAALERASKLLRCLPADRLHAEDLANNTAAPPAGPTLHERTEPAAMGEVTAFLSHSWSDENEAPGAKHAAVSRWAARHREKTGSEPTLWLVWDSPDRNLFFTLAPHDSPHTCRHRIARNPRPRLARRRTRRASTRATSNRRSRAFTSSSRAARRFSSWLGPRTAQGCGASWSSLRLYAVTACNF